MDSTEAIQIWTLAIADVILNKPVVPRWICDYALQQKLLRSHYLFRIRAMSPENDYEDLGSPVG